MTSVVIIADSGTELARLTASVRTIRGAEVVRHVSGGTRGIPDQRSRRSGTRRTGRVIAMTPSLAANSPTEGA